MSEQEEDYDELPPITVNSSARDSSSFSMPCASQLAEQRAREERCEQEILQLREDHAAATENIVSCIAHSDSSGSEGEAALAAAVSALRVRAAAGATRARPALSALLVAAAPLLAASAAAFLADYADATRGAPEHFADAIAEDILGSICGMVQEAAAAGATWEAEEAQGAGAWLCLALAARGARRLAPRLARAAHLLLDDVAPEGAAEALAPALLAALPDARERLELSDALRSGGAGAERLAGALGAAALRGLLAGGGGAGEAAAWRRLHARDQYVALQLAGRARAHAAPGAERVLAALAAAAPAARDHQPDSLKVLVAASKLQVLFQAKK